MRVPFTAQPTSGHWHPLAPLAEALRVAGHDVAFATTPVGCSAISAIGFRCFPAGADETAEEGQALRARLAALGAEGPAWVMPNLFAGKWAGRRLPDLLAICRNWEPALVVREDTEFAGYVAAEGVGLPHAAVQISAGAPGSSRSSPNR